MSRRLDHYLKLIRWAAKRHARALGRWYTLEDLAQEGACCFLQCRSLYDPAKGEFSTYLVSVLDNHYRRMRDTLHAKGRDAFTKPYEDVHERHFAIDPNQTEQEFVLDMLRIRDRCKGDLSLFVQAILSGAFDSVADFKRGTGLSAHQINQIAFRLRNLMGG